MTKFQKILSIGIIGIAIFAGCFGFSKAQDDIGATINSLPMFKSTTTPYTAVTPRSYGKDIYTPGTYYGGFFVGDGSGLTGIPGGVQNWTINPSGQLTPSTTVDVLFPANATTTGQHYFGQGIQLEKITAPDYEPGLLFYEEYGALDGLSFYDDETDTTLNLGKEIWKDVRNCNSGSTIENGTAVYLTGTVVSQVPCILPASATTELNATVVGVTTHDIENNSNGVITKYGVLNSINTNDLTDGDILYLATSTDGFLNEYRNLTTTKPTAPFFKVRVGEVDYSHPTLGKIEVDASFPHNLNDNQDVMVDTPLNNQLMSYNTSNGYWSNVSDITVNDATITGTLTAGDYEDIESLWDGTQSAGWIDGFTFEDNTDGTFDVGGGKGLFKKTNSEIGENTVFSINATSTLWAVDDEEVYVYVNYNAGSPVVATSTDNLANSHTIFNLGQVFREDTDLHFFRAGQVINDIPKRIIQRFNADGNIQLVSGGLVAESGERYLTVTNAELWGGLVRFLTGSIDTTGADTFEYYYTTAGGDWQYLSETASQINNTQYDNGGTLTALTSNRYRTDFAYLTNDGDLLVILGTNNDTLADAQAETPPTSIPPHADFGTVIAKIIVQEGGTNLEEVDNLEGSIFSGSGTVIHNETTNIQGGTTDEYYHLTNADYTELSSWLPNVTLGSDGSATGTNLYLSGDFTVAGDTSVKDITLVNQTITGNATVTNHFEADATLYVKDSNVGIGTVTPNVKTEIYGSETNTQVGAGDSAALRISNAAGGANDIAEIQMGRGVNDKIGVAISYKHTNGNDNTQGDLLFSTRPVSTDANLTPAMTILASGKVGIGTTAPARLLEISSTAASAYARLTSPAGYSSGFEMFQGASQKMAVGYYNTDDAVKINYGDLTDNHLVINSSGYVGIGTSTPVSTLTVDGTFAVGTNGNEFTVNEDGNATSTRETITDGTNGLRIIPGATTTLDFF